MILFCEALSLFLEITRLQPTPRPQSRQASVRDKLPILQNTNLRHKEVGQLAQNHRGKKQGVQVLAGRCTGPELGSLLLHVPGEAVTSRPSPVGSEGLAQFPCRLRGALCAHLERGVIYKDTSGWGHVDGAQAHSIIHTSWRTTPLGWERPLGAHCGTAVHIWGSW